MHWFTFSQHSHTLNSQSQYAAVLAAHDIFSFIQCTSLDSSFSCSFVSFIAVRFLPFWIECPICYLLTSRERYGWIPETVMHEASCVIQLSFLCFSKGRAASAELGSSVRH